MNGISKSFKKTITSLFTFPFKFPRFSRVALNSLKNTVSWMEYTVCLGSHPISKNYGRHEFDSEQIPDLTKDVYIQDIHCVGSLCKLYFRELPNPLLTYQLYEKFSDAVSAATDEERLVKIHDVIQQLPPPHYREVGRLISVLSRIKNKMRMLAEVSQTSGLEIWKTFRDFLFAGLENVAAACYIQYVGIQHQRLGT
ncbi:hypothetical protein Chor_005614 [Crotalus horridus]